MNELLALLEILIRDLIADLTPVTDLHVMVFALLLVLAFTWDWERGR